VFAPPGVSLGETVEKLGARIGAEVADIEDEIKQNPRTHEILRRIDASFIPPFDMQTVAHHIPRTQVAELWQEALDNCLDKLEKSRKAVRILSGHVIYYSLKRREFYSVVSFGSLINRGRFKVDKILLLIDDIYDMYTRLSKFYSPNEIVSLIRRLDSAKKASLQNPARATMLWKTRNILHLLHWRNMEPIFAENLAHQLRADIMIWPVKQMNAAIEKWLLSKSKSVYLSHPITDPRTERNLTGRWPDFVNQVNRLQRLFIANGITLVEPTAIDELRFSASRSRLTKNRFYNGRLDARWPLIERRPTDMLYVQPRDAKGMEYFDFMTPHYWDIKSRRMKVARSYSKLLKDEMHAYCQVLVGEIESQIAGRDFLFVYHTQGLLVFRPYYGRVPRPGFSSGVESEVRLWEDMVQLGVPSRIAFVHFEEDVRSMLKVQKKSDIRREIVDQMWIMLKRVSNVDRDIIEAMVMNHGRLQEREEILNRSNVSPADAERFERAFKLNWRNAKIEVLRRHLNDAISVGVGDKMVGVWVVRNYKILQCLLPEVSVFLEKEWPSGKPMPPGNNWEEEIDSLFGDEVIA
jgi:hypothetical protein